MKAIHYIILTVILIGAGFGIYILEEKKKKEIRSSESNRQDDKTVTKAKPIYPNLPPEIVKDLQRKINNVYRLYNKPLIETDGIYGRDTDKGVKFMAAVRNQTPNYANIKDDKGETYTVNFSKVFDKSYQLLKDLTGITAAKNLFGF